MEQIISYFSTIPSAHRTFILVSGLVFFWLLEGFIPLSKKHYNKPKHIAINIFFNVTTLVVNFLFAFIIVRTADFVSSQGIGLIWLTELPIWLMIILGFLTLDLVGAYFIHFIEHKVHWMWKFHVIHHSDTNVDVTTSLRHHPGESIFRAVFTILAVAIAGAPIWLVMLYQSSSAILSQFNHGNVRLPQWLDRFVKTIFITPNMHRVHHHFKQPYTDKNYGNIFSFWDRIFNTYGDLNADNIVYGLDVFEGNDEDIGHLLKLPFDGKNYHRN